MGTTFMSSRNSKTSHPHRLLLNPSDKINLKISDKYVALSDLIFTDISIKKYKKIIQKQ